MYLQYVFILNQSFHLIMSSTYSIALKNTFCKKINEALKGYDIYCTENKTD